MWGYETALEELTERVRTLRKDAERYREQSRDHAEKSELADAESERCDRIAAEYESLIGAE